MRKVLLILCFLSGLNSFAQDDLLLHIDGKTIEISSDQEYDLPINGKMVKVKVSTKDTLLFDTDLFSFLYSKDYKVSSMKLAEGIEQVTIMTAEGSGLLIQKYSAMNPSMLNELMLNEVTKESINYGFEMKRENYSRKLISGQQIEISKAILTYKDETNIYEVASLGRKDEGILIMTMIMDENYSEQGRKLIDLMWDSLTYK
ncbi:hypothetical protein [Salinimicrobium gaetbulicola]|uniref:Uncharacterized protein n=1 Tax=Salinimicrobium gaetbulicola TaxID=999702 RepID=A0ABW3IE09_9FLAO